ncbi:MAG: TlyA family RNA methyltransferase [Anaerolineales bacterium]|nr:TlyA family RNA methyltransferase [Anaerolineales bacterium]
MAKKRLDVLMVERGLVDSRSMAQRLVMAGRVRIDGQTAFKPGMGVASQVEITVDEGAAFVSRGGEKLEAALQSYELDIRGKVCADVGASTGGFTDCLLQHGATRVYTIDVGHGILAWNLRQDDRVVVMERQNARHITHLPEPVSLITVDVSFISLKVLLPVFRGWFFESTLTPPAPSSNSGKGGEGVRNEIIALIKPQFEAGRAEVKRGAGVIRDPQVHRKVLLDVLSFAQQAGYSVCGLIRSPLLGPKGNVEFLAWLGYPIGEPGNVIEYVDMLIPDTSD